MPGSRWRLAVGAEHCGNPDGTIPSRLQRSVANRAARPFARRPRCPLRLGDRGNHLRHHARDRRGDRGAGCAPGSPQGGVRLEHRPDFGRAWPALDPVRRHGSVRCGADAAIRTARDRHRCARIDHAGPGSDHPDHALMGAVAVLGRSCRRRDGSHRHGLGRHGGQPLVPYPTRPGPRLPHRQRCNRTIAVSPGGRLAVPYAWLAGCPAAADGDVRAGRRARVRAWRRLSRGGRSRSLRYARRSRRRPGGAPPLIPGRAGRPSGSPSRRLPR